MDARLQFEFSNDKAKSIVKILFDNAYLGTGNSDIVNRDDAEYAVTLSVNLKHKRKSRKKKDDE